MKENTKLEWLIVMLFGVTAYVLAFIGFKTYFAANGVDRNILDLIFYSVKIFGMEVVGDYVSPLPLTLEIARWLAPGVLIYTAIKGIIYLVGRTFLMMRVKRYRGHFIIEGINRGSVYLINDILRKGMKVIVLSENFTDAEREIIERDGATLIAGSLKDNDTLKQVNAGKAAYIISLEEEDDKNISSSVFVSNYLSAQKDSAKPLVFAHVADVQKLTELKEIKFFKNLQYENGIKTGFDVRVFSAEERAARILFNKYSPDIFTDKTKPSSDPLNIVIIGDNDLTETILIHFARMCHYTNFRKTNINLFHSDQKILERISFNYPNLSEHINLKMTLIDPELINPEKIVEINRKQSIDAIYLISDNDGLISKILNRLAAIEFGKKVNTVTAINNPESILGKWFNTKTLGDLLLHKYNIATETYTEEAIIGRKIDSLARVIHNDYLAKIKQSGKLNPEKESHCEWKFLSEDFKNQNRFQADHIWAKLRSIRCRAVPVDEVAEEYDYTKDASIVEMLSKMEHHRWAAHMSLNGWRYGSVRDDKKKIHTDLIEYEKLSEEIKQYDRDAVINIKHILSEMNLKIVKEL